MIYICVEGNIGAGKTTLVKKIAERHPVHAIYEQFSENPFLELFYKEPQKHSFPLEMSFLAERFQQLNTIFTAPDLFHDIYIADYSFLKCLVFASQTLSPEDFHVFQLFYKILIKQLPKPDYIFYLNDDVNQLQKNIYNRGRSFESHITENYLKSIEKSYNWHFIGTDKTKLIQIPSYSKYHHIIDLIADAVFSRDIESITQIIGLSEISS